jgi:lipopolysaccharide transport system ATP-binding protein
MTLIKIENLSKKYLIHHKHPGTQTTLVETLSRKGKEWIYRFRNGFKSLPKQCDPTEEEFWALKEVNLSIQEGDRVGIIGRNGAGKSTLLKVLSRITEPTHGRVTIRGRVASLLEVGTGFHPELTGRENIFLNGAILGMTKREIRKKFDEIVAFADVEKFLDTPVKRYSSGMYTRLGFAIAAHLEPDLLIVDEVLSVGDIQFQEKCLKKMNELGASGRTILFVSHDVGSVISLCNRCVYLEKGKVRAEGSVEACVNAYMQDCRKKHLSWVGQVGDEHIQFSQFALTSQTSSKEFFYQDEWLNLNLEYEIYKHDLDLNLGFSIWNQRNQLVARTSIADDIDQMLTHIKLGKHRLQFPLTVSLFHEGEYTVKLECSLHNRKQITQDEIHLFLPVYSRKKNTRFGNLGERGGVFLGNHWQQHDPRSSSRW